MVAKPLVCAAALTLAAQAAYAQSAPDVATPDLSLAEELRDGMRIITGVVSPILPDGSGVRIIVRRSSIASNLARRNHVQTKSTKEFGEDGTFTVTLEAPLRAGQVVVAEAFDADGATIPGAASDIVEVVDPGNWGRARAYFAGGAVFSKDRDDFSKQDLSISFVMDKTWLQSPDFTLGPSATVRREVQRQVAALKAAEQRVTSNTALRAVIQRQLEVLDKPEDEERRGGWRPRQFNTFFDARLTALPVKPAEEGGSDVAPDIVDSRKGALVQVGMYAPIYGPQTAWEHDGAIHALFLAPVARGGIATIPRDDDDPPDTDPDDVHKFYSVGFGIGLHKLSGTTNQTPELINYLHVTWGQAEAFEIVKDGVTTKPRRIFVEGRLMIPNTALQVGFDANLGQGADDVRFMFGTRFDIGELIGRLSSFQ